MNVENWEIRIGGFKEFKAAVLSQIGKPADGKVLYLTLKQFPKMFSKRRVELLRAIRKHPDAGVVELARILGRHQEAISRDLGYLRAVGIVSDGVPSKPVNKTPSNILFNVSIPA